MKKIFAFSPYRLHDEAHNHGQTHTPAHHSYYNSCDFTCAGKAQRGSADRGKPPRMQWCDYLQHQRGCLVFCATKCSKSDTVLPEESSFPDSATKREIDEWETFHLCKYFTWMSLREVSDTSKWTRGVVYVYMEASELSTESLGHEPLELCARPH